MLSYQHIYHAGNHADVLKHAVLLLVLAALQRKPTPLRVVDAHAGSGRYDLGAVAARSTGESAGGIGRVLAAGGVPAALAPYVAAVRALNPRGALRYYPGSPLLARRALRGGDRLTLLERHPQAVADLHREFAGDRQVQVQARDSYTGLPVLLPPPERRGLVLIDPSYELKDEYQRVLRLLRTAYRRWPGGVYLVWYPVIRRPAALGFARTVARAGIPRIWQGELTVLPEQHPGLRGSGLLVVNLPWGLDQVLGELLPWLWRTLAQDGAGDWLAHWLVPEQSA